MNPLIEKEKMFFDEANLTILPDTMEGVMVKEIQEAFIIYRSAIKEVRTKLDILDDELKIKRERNPIEYIKSRVKSPRSILGKLQRKGLEMSIDSAKNNLNDIAGIRVVCSFLSDIYEVADMLKRQDDIKVIEEKDYIKNPKANGYRSLHLVLEIPVFLSNHMERAKIEVQIRTIAMDFWASLEHKLYYKSVGDPPTHITEDLKECAEIISLTDMRMQSIQKEVENLN